MKKIRVGQMFLLGTLCMAVQGCAFLFENPEDGDRDEGLIVYKVTVTPGKIVLEEQNRYGMSVTLSYSCYKKGGLERVECPEELGEWEKLSGITDFEGHIHGGYVSFSVNEFSHWLQTTHREYIAFRNDLPPNTTMVGAGAQVVILPRGATQGDRPEVAEVSIPGRLFGPTIIELKAADGTQSKTAFEIFNTGTEEELIILGIEKSGSDKITVSGRTSTPFRLGAGRYLSYLVSFQPDAVGSFIADLTFTWQGELALEVRTKTIRIKGQATE